MVEYKLLGTLLVVLCGVLIGRALNRSASAVPKQIGAWICLLRFTALQIECFSLPVEEILRRVDSEILAECGFGEKKRPSRFGELMDGCQLLDGELAEILRNFSESFGKGYREEQLRECAYYIELLEARRKTVDTHLGGKKKLNTTLSLSGALALVLFFL